MLQDKLPDLANLAVAATVFGQFVGGQAFSAPVAIAGVVPWVVLMFGAYVLGGTNP